MIDKETEDNLTRHFSLSFNTSEDQLSTSNIQPGKLYEQLLFMYTLINNQKIVFDLGKEIKFGDKWDDLVVKEYENNYKYYTFVQIKLVDSSNDVDKFIDSKVLLGKRKVSLKENDFKLQKYFKSYLRIKDQLNSRNDKSKIKKLIVFTNAQLNTNELNRNFGSINLKMNDNTVVPNTNIKFAENIDITYEIKKVKDYFIREMIKNLKSDFINVAEELAMYVTNSRPETMILDKDFLAYYHISLIDEKVIEIVSVQSGKKIIKRAKFTQNFINSQILSHRAQNLRNKLSEIIKKKGMTDQLLLENMKIAEWTVSDDFDLRFTQDHIFLPNYDIVKKDIIDFFKVLELRVKQLDVKDIINMIMNVEIKKTFLEYYDTDPKLVEFLINDFVQSWRNDKSMTEIWILNEERSKFVEKLKMKISKPKAIHKTQESVKYLLDICNKYDLYYDDSCLFVKSDFNNNFVVIKTESNILTSAKLIQSLYKMKLQHSIFIDLDKLVSQKEIIKLIDAFRSDEERLFIISYTLMESDTICEDLFSQLSGIVQKNRKKKVVFISPATDDPLMKKCLNRIGYKEFEDKLIGLQYLKRASKILEQKITVQNHSLTLADFIGNVPTDYNVIDAKIIEGFIKNKQIHVGSKPLSTSNLDGAYLDLVEDFSLDTFRNIMKSEASNNIYLISSAFGSDHTKKLLISVKKRTEDVSRTRIDFMDKFIQILNHKDITKFINNKIQVCNFIINKDNFKQICLSNPNRKIYWITMKYDGATPKLTLEQLYNPEFYTKGKRFNYEILLNQCIKTLLLSNDLLESFIIILRNKSEFENWLQLAIDKDKKQFRKNCQRVIRLVTCENDGKVVFEKIIKYNPTCTVHLLKFEQNYLFWFKTYGSLEKLIKFRERNPKELCEEDVLIKEIKDRKEVIFVGDPGIGKSTALVKLYEANYASESSAEEALVNSHWLIRVNLEDAVKDINVKASDMVTIIKEITIFLSQMDQTLNSDFARNLLGLALLRENFTKPLLILFDGFDEVLDKVDRNKIIFLLRCIKDKTKAKFWITSRIHLQYELENALSTFAIKLEKMNDDQIDTCVKKYLDNIFSLFCNYKELRKVFSVSDEIMKNMKIDTFTTTFTSAIQNIFRGDVSRFIGTPLQLYLMLGDTVRYFIKWMNNNTNQPPDLSYLGTDIWTVYEKFIEGKNTVYFRKANIKEQLRQDQYHVIFDDYHRNFAKSSMFNSILKKDMEYFRDIFLMAGMITSNGNHIEFIHPTFREYFASKEILHWVAKWKKEASNNFINFNKQEYLLGEVLIKPEFKMVRTFLNARLLKENFENIQLQDVYYDKYILSAAARENNVGILKFALQNVNIANINSYYETPLLHVAVERGNWDIIQFLIEKKVNINSKNYYSYAETVLHKTARFGVIEILKYLIEHGADVNAKDSNNTSVLHCAVRSKNLEVVKILIENGAFVNFKDENGKSVLHAAVRCCNLEVIEMLVKGGADINAIDNLNKSVLHNASEYSNLEIVEYLVANGASMNSKDKKNTSILHLAALTNKLEIVQFLVSKQIDVNAIDCNKVSVLHNATKSANPEIVFYLIDNGAIVNAKDKYNRSVLHYAAEYSQFEVVEFLVTKGANVNVKSIKKKSVLHLAAERGNLEMVKLFVSKGVDIHAKDINNKSILHYAAKSGSFEMVNFFIEKGIPINDQDKTGISVLHIAAQLKNVKMVKLLLEKGGNIYSKTSSGISILNSAAEYSILDFILLLANSEISIQRKETEQDHLDDATIIAEILFSKGANVNDTDDNGKSALHRGAESHNFGLVKFLAKNGASFDAKDKNKKTVLHSAVESSSLDMVKLVVARGIHVNAKDNKGITALHIATSNNCFDIAEYLVSEGADVNAQDEDKKTVLHGKFLNFAIFKFLVEAGADVTARDKNNRSVLHYAVASLNLEMVKFCISAGANVNAKDEDDKLVLHYAAETHYLAMIKYLVRVGADVNALDKNNKSVLHIASRSGAFDVVDFLVKSHANVHAVDKNKTSVLHCAAEFGCFEMVEYLVTKGVNINAKDINDKSILLSAAESNKLDVVKFLVAKGACVDVKDISGWSILHIAAKNNNVAMVQFLLEAGADIKVEDIYNRSILHYAVDSSDLNLVKVILEAGVNVNSQDIELKSALYTAAQNQNFPVVKYLIENGANVNVVDKDLKSVLHVVAKFGNLDVVKFLVINGADVNAKDLYKTTVLHNAVESCNLELVQFLVRKGLDINAKDEFNSSVLHVATKFEDHSDIVKYLVGKGADINTKDNNDNTVLHNVAKFGDLEIVEFLVANGGDLKAKDKNGISILQAAEESANLDLILFIEKAEA